MQCAYTSDVEEILKFKTFKGFKKQVACKTAKTKKWCGTGVTIRYSKPSLIQLQLIQIDMKNTVHSISHTLKDT
jgi:hypothetical protein